MSDLLLESFRGEAPRLAPHLLPPNGAQEATNCRLQSGNLESWRHFLLTRTLVHAAAVRTIYKLNGAWLSWTSQVDVARGLIPGDNTFRVYLTSPGLYATPRWTNYALATTGAEPYPVATRPIGVPNPTTAPTLDVGVAAVPTVSVSDAGDQLATTWTTSPIVSSGGTVSNVTQDAGVGNPTPSYRLQYANNVGYPCYAYRDFGVADSSSVDMSVDVAFIGVTIDAGVRVRCNAAGSGLLVGVGVIGGSTQFFIGTASQWGGSESPLATSALPPLDNTASVFYRIQVRTTLNPTGTLTVIAELYNGVTLLATVTATGSFDLGGFCGVDGSSANSHATYYDNFLIEGSGSATAIQNTGTNYVYTFVNDVGEESGPSPLSETILRPDGVSVTVTTPTSAPGDPSYNVTDKRIYRSVTGLGGTVFQRVGTIPLATATFVDSLDDAETGPQVLETQDYDLPPADLQGLRTLPNGIMAGFRRNQLCLSEAGRPHAWPVKYRLPTDTDIVAIENIDNTIVIGTKSFVYTATGTTPGSYSMSKPGEPQACASKLGMTYIDGLGVVFPSPDGWQLCRGAANNVTNLTRTIFTKRQWEALNPASIIAGTHDGVLHFFCDGPNPDAGYALDMNEDGFGLIRLSYHAIALHVDPLLDALHLVLDGINEPTDALLPIPPVFTLPGGAAIRIYQFDADPARDLVYRWRGRLNLLPYPIAFQFAKVRCATYANIVASFIGDGVTKLKRAMTSLREFRVRSQADNKPDDRYEVEFIGTSRVRTSQVAESSEELV